VFFPNLKARSKLPRRRKERRAAQAERKKIKAKKKNKAYGVERREGGKRESRKLPKRGRKDRILLEKSPRKRIKDELKDGRSESKTRRKEK
jgi:hypothetical protein